jgi:hypothetical protein
MITITPNIAGINGTHAIQAKPNFHLRCKNYEGSLER